MAETTTNRVSDSLLETLKTIAGDKNIIESGPRAEKFSKDFYWYSPILKKQMDHLSAEVVVRVTDKEVLRKVIQLCVKNQIPITPRGAGTGNYGQSIPLYGGVLVDFSKMDKIFSVQEGVAHVEPGARLIKIETEARAHGWELRCYPSTIVTASMGGFLCGGSGGIGSITWGGINNADNVKSVTIMTAEEEPREVRFEERDSIQALHTYGTTGFMIDIEMRLAPKRDYEQCIFVHEDWDHLLDWTDSIARKMDLPKRLVTLFQDPIPQYFTPILEHLPEKHHAAFFYVERSHAATLLESAKAQGIKSTWQIPYADPPKPPYITDYTWNHTTLWALKSDDSLTYLQSGFGDNFREQFKQLWEKFPGEILFHLEWTVGNSKMESQAVRMTSGDDVLVGGLPIIRYKSPERLQEIIDYCEEIGVFTANPHTYILEEGGKHPDIENKRQLKASVDPKGILNPGKMKTFALNPFA